MPVDSLALLLFFFVAVACGWFAARYAGRLRRPANRDARINPEYFKGLNYLLDDKPDKAIEVFVSMMSVDNETVETHFALGSLFRRRGEVDRAIRIHQNLIARPNLGREFRDQALFALAEDYLRAGLLDRAEGLFEKLSGQSTRRADALSKLTTIYEQQKDWPQAISARRQLSADAHSDRIIAHYHCELAEDASAKHDDASAKAHLKKAQTAVSGLARSAMMRAAIATREGDTRTAQRLYRKVLEDDPRFVTEVWSSLASVFNTKKSPEGFPDFLSALARKNPRAVEQIAFAAIVHDDVEHDAARLGMREFLKTHSTLLEALTSLGVVAPGTKDVTDEQLARIAGGLRALLRNRAGYCCEHCGYASEQLYWQCPGCKTWDSIRPNTHLPVARLTLAAGV